MDPPERTMDAGHGGDMIITIDGPAGTGKSTVAHLLACRLGIEYLDTGAMYRAVTLLAIESAIDPANGDALAEAISDAGLHVDWGVDPPRLLIGTRDISDRIRDLDVSEKVSIVAAQPEVRFILVDQQRRIAEEHPRIVTEGRDQGSVVFPDATVQFYLEAAEGIRVQRRQDQLQSRGCEVTLDRIREDIRNRDHIDSTRRDAPLVRPHGAFLIDTSYMTIEEVVDAMEQVVREAQSPADASRQ